MNYEYEIEERIKQTKEYMSIISAIETIESMRVTNQDPKKAFYVTVTFLRHGANDMLLATSVIYQRVKRDMQNRKELNNGCTHTRENA